VYEENLAAAEAELGFRRWAWLCMLAWIGDGDLCTQVS
jgi:hypothetical protein